ncbi:MBL fold metallo-hydrolase [Paraglaciecola polaris]|uniref:Metallo-beta-lactamase domain protein n=1 Tax=Paraglaciecola polaris LMG 21857 TaxID=1129793 RepID=K7A200_9ALTE|nr:MBL fold metallo-hydrolase [Paraglaciecola polaris]GAC34963.1 metallo-beta-lactamase domain protein [Paraglaciecola polaris LMG 21857]
MTIDFIDVQAPEPGEWQQVSPGILWLRMPLPFELDHINLYLIEDNDPVTCEKGYALIDTGFGVNKTQEIWDSLLSQLNVPLTKIIVTHMHPDHIGMAGYLVDKYRAPLYMSHSEYFVGRAMSAGSRGASDWQDDEYLVRCGMSAEYVATASENRKTNKGVGQVIRPIPLHHERLQEGDTLKIGAGDWQIMIGRGHSPEHVCLFNPTTNVLISGDHVLPIITPNIGVYSTEPNANSLKMYLDTLPQFKNLPADALVLPSHKQPFVGLHSRVDTLIAHHHEHLGNLKAFCQEGKTIKECLPVLFKRELNEHNMFFAIAEALAHLNYLYFEQQLTRGINDKGQYVFTLRSAK